MADEPLDPERRPEAGPRTEGVRIIGATEAGEAVSRSEEIRWAEATEAVDAVEVGSTEPLETTATERPSLEFPPADAPSVEPSAAIDEVVSELPPVEPEQSFEMPHYSDPPTGQVPKVVIGEETEASWSGLADQPRWRDTEHHFDEQGGFDDLVDDAPRLGALGHTGEHRDFFDDLDLTEDKVPTLSGAPSRENPVVGSATPADDTAAASGERRPPAPRRRRPATDRPGGDRPVRAGALGADNGSGNRNLPMALAVGVGLLAIGGLCFFLGSVATMVLITVVLTLCAVELFSSLTDSGYRPAGLLGIVAVAGLCIAPLYFSTFAYPIIFGLTTLTGLAWFLFVQPGEGAVMNLGVTLLGVAYVGGLGSFATLLLGVARPYEGTLSNQGIGVLLAAVLVTVSYDVGAYFIGRSFGHTPLSTVSPNKTQEGLVGGVIVAIVVPFLILWLSKLDPVGVDFKTTIGFCLICALMAPIGDLCESAIKRDLGVKDMGTLLPGHGGVLDRFDAMLFVLPTAYFMAHLLSLGKPAFF
ncbi:MAG: phosphatidate cytidylyltransferase [Acidimicrobiales bacterium]